MPSHRLTILKNLKTNKFEIMRVFNTNNYDRPFDISKGVDGDVVAFSGSFDEALKFVNKEYDKRWGSVSTEYDYENHQDVEITYKFEYIACKHSGENGVDRESYCSRYKDICSASKTNKSYSKILKEKGIAQKNIEK